MTGSSPTGWYVGGLAIVVGLFLVRYARNMVVSAVVVIGLGITLNGSNFATPAVAACSPDESSLLQGDLRVEGGSLTSAELPVLTVTNGTTTLTARWGMPTTDGVDTVVSFAVTDIAPGDWSLEITESESTSFNLSGASWPLVVNSSRLLTGGPFNATTASPQHISVSGVRITITVSRS